MTEERMKKDTVIKNTEPNDHIETNAAAIARTAKGSAMKERPVKNSAAKERLAKNHVTFDDIARYTHFSKTTVSRYFNKPETLTEKNRQIISRALVELNYQENKVAHILATGKTEYVGIIIPNLFLHYFSEMLNQILATYDRYGYKFLVFVAGEDEASERKYLKELLSYQIEGLLVMSHTLSSAELASLGIPVVSIEREDRHISSVNCDNYMGGVQAVSLLSAHNCDILLHVNSPTDPDKPAYQRVRGFEDSCRDYNVPYEIIIRDTGDSHAATMRTMAGILDEIENKYSGKKKGIFFSDDTRANCFLNLLLRKYQKVPDSYRLVGFDNSPVSLQSVYSLSTVGQQIDVIAQEAVRLLRKQILFRRENGADAVFPIEHRLVSPVVCRRETTELYEA